MYVCIFIHVCVCVYIYIHVCVTKTRIILYIYIYTGKFYTPNPTHTCTHVCTYIHMYTYFTVLAIHIQMYAYLRERMTISRDEGGRRRKLLLPLMRRCGSLRAELRIRDGGRLLCGTMAVTVVNKSDHHESLLLFITARFRRQDFPEVYTRLASLYRRKQCLFRVFELQISLRQQGAYLCCVMNTLLSAIRFRPAGSVRHQP